MVFECVCTRAASTEQPSTKTRQRQCLLSSGLTVSDVVRMTLDTCRERQSPAV